MTRYMSGVNASIGLCVLLVAAGTVFSRFFSNPGVAENITNALIFTIALVLVLAFRMNDSLSPSRHQWGLAIALTCSGIAPLIFPQIYPGNNLAWLISNLGVGAYILLARAISEEVIWHAFAFLNFGSLLTLLAGQVAFSEDTRSLAFSFRLTGLMGHPNVTAFMSALTIVYAFHKKRYFSPVTVAAFVVSAGTLSLTSIICLIFGVLILWLKSTKKVAITIVLGTLSASLTPLVGVLLLGYNLNPELFTNRTSIWTWLRAYGAPPDFGYGLGFLNIQQSAGQVLWVHAHNQAFMSYYTLGVVGLLSVVVIMIVLFSQVKKNFNPISAAFLAMLAIEATTEVPLFLDYPSGRWMVTVLLCIVVFSGSDYNPEVRKTRSKVFATMTRSDSGDQFST